MDIIIQCLKDAMAYKSHSRAVSDLKAHLVLTTKYRRQVITAPMLKRIGEIFDDLCQKWGSYVVEFNGEEDHVHLLFSYYPQMQLSKFVNNIKTLSVSSLYIRACIPRTGETVLLEQTSFLAFCLLHC